jgi:hypothetical protein
VPSGWLALRTGIRSTEPSARAVPEIRLPSGSSTWTRPETGVTPSLNVTTISLGEVPMMLPGAGTEPSSDAWALAGDAGRTSSPSTDSSGTRTRRHLTTIGSDPVTERFNWWTSRYRPGVRDVRCR